MDDLKTTILFGMWSIIPYFVYLATLYVMVDRLRLEASLAVAAGSVVDGCDYSGQRLGTPPQLTQHNPNVGGGLPPIAVGQTAYLLSDHRHRGQAPSHI